MKSLTQAGFQAARTLLSVIALSGFAAGPVSLAWIYLLTSISGLAMQGALTRSPLLAFWTGGFRVLRFETLRDIPYSVTDPASSWMRMQLPVVVFAGFMPPTFTTTFVAVRAAFGVARSTAAQVSRFVSVRYAHSGYGETQQTIAIRGIFTITVIGMAIASVAIADDGRLLRVWLGASHVQDSRAIIACFAAGALGFGSQVAAAILVRLGRLVVFVQRQYAYIGLGLVAALGAPWLPHAADLYLICLAVLEIGVAGLFVWAFGPTVQDATVRDAAVMAFLLAATVLLGLTGLVVYDLGGVFTASTRGAAFWSNAACVLAVACVALPLLVSPRATLRLAPRGLTR